MLDLHDRGVVFGKLEVWAGPEGDVRDMCDRLRRNLLSIPLWNRQDAGDFYRTIKALCRELGRVVGEPQDLPIGKCSRPDPEGFQCRGQLFRTIDGRAVYCRRCGDKPELKEQEVWVTLRQAAQVAGVAIETVRTWYKRGHVGWSPPLRPGMCWLPIVVRRAADRRTTTVPHSSGTVNHGSGAELSPDTTGRGSSPLSASGSSGSGSDADVLGQSRSLAVTPGNDERNNRCEPSAVDAGADPGSSGNVTPPDVATSGKAVAPDPVDGAPEQGSPTGFGRGKSPSTAASSTPKTDLFAGRQGDRAGEDGPGAPQERPDRHP